MHVCTTIPELRERLAEEKHVALVPTMGNLHAGHLSLVEQVKKAQVKQENTCVVTSIFVNPLQFGPKEDFGRYPRTFADDCAALERVGNDVVFAPDMTEFYPVPQEVFVLPPAGMDLEHAARPTHFQGVLTVVMKLFQCVQPQVAIFGKKDYQQLYVIRRMVEQFNMPITLLASETMRESDGLAMSSRNQYLSPTERTEATYLNMLLLSVIDAVRQGHESLDAVERAAEENLRRHGWQPDYIAVRSQATLQPPQPEETALVVLGAARLGTTRLIDNREFTI
jgi:pantoate--beta-alanine ligase